MKKRRIAATILAACLLTAAFGSCGNEGDSSTSSKATSSADSGGTESSQSGEAFTPTYPITDEDITVTGVVVGKDMTHERSFWKQLGEFTGINYEFINVEGDAFNVYLAAGEWPDFFHIGIGSTQAYEYGVLGQKLVNYNDWLDYMPNLQAVFEEYPLAEKSSRSQDGGIYVLPRIEESSTLSMCRLHYRTDFLEENGLEEPTTIDEFYDVLTKCKEINNGAAPLVTGIDEGQYTGSLLYPAFGDYARPNWNADDSGKVFFGRVEQQYRDYLTYVHKLYDEGLIHQEYATMDSNAFLALVQEGTGIFFAECAMSVTAEMFPDGQLHIGTLSPFVMNKGDTPVCAETQPVMPFSNFAINADSPYIEELVRTFDIAFATEEVAPGSNMYGITFFYGDCIKMDPETKTYTLQDPSGAETNTTFIMENVVYDWCGLQQMGEYITSTPGNSQERQKGYASKVLPYATGTLFPDRYFTYTEEEQAVIDQYKVEFDSYVNEMKNKFIMGVEDISNDATWDNYVSTLETLGMSELQAVYQSAYDRLNAE